MSDIIKDPRKFGKFILELWEYIKQEDVRERAWLTSIGIQDIDAFAKLDESEQFAVIKDKLNIKL